MINKDSGYRPTLKLHEEVECSKEDLKLIQETFSKLDKEQLNHMFMTNLIYGTSGCEIKKDGIVRSLGINELTDIELKNHLIKTESLIIEEIIERYSDILTESQIEDLRKQTEL